MAKYQPSRTVASPAKVQVPQQRGISHIVTGMHEVMQEAKPLIEETPNSDEARQMVLKAIKEFGVLEGTTGGHRVIQEIRGTTEILAHMATAVELAGHLKDNKDRGLVERVIEIGLEQSN